MELHIEIDIHRLTEIITNEGPLESLGYLLKCIFGENEVKPEYVLKYSQKNPEKIKKLIPEEMWNDLGMTLESTEGAVDSILSAALLNMKEFIEIVQDAVVYGIEGESGIPESETTELLRVVKEGA